MAQCRKLCVACKIGFLPSSHISPNAIINAFLATNNRKCHATKRDAFVRYTREALVVQRITRVILEREQEQERGSKSKRDVVLLLLLLFAV